MIDYRSLRERSFPVIEHRYTAEDSMRYALALGLGDDPGDELLLPFVTDTRPGWPWALPTMAVVLGFPGSWMQEASTGIDFARIVHGEETLELFHPLPAAGTVRAHHRVTRIVDKGPGRGATISYDKDLIDAASGVLLARVTHTTFARGDGGFSARDGLSDEPLPAPAPLPTRAPDQVCELDTLPQQALLYRLCADRNPLHADPVVARAAGFERPILHGLCTYGIAGRVLLAQRCGNDPRRLQRLHARFSAPVYPGERLRFELFDEGATLRFRVLAVQRDKLVLDHGEARVAG
jgi:acyl dehydratase